ncbi:hypothetical protein BDY24DRAFT_323504, partial [Mrakia frigida]|uniref:uncharacterized protein n=1 Tax=Mrakia frigida TaxID=29902 RepID=UPI003FCC1E50
IVLRRRHPKINNYNPLLVNLVRGNMDVKPLFSGYRSLTSIHYCTKYMTKNDVAIH